MSEIEHSFAGKELYFVDDLMDEYRPLNYHLTLGWIDPSLYWIVYNAPYAMCKWCGGSSSTDCQIEFKFYGSEKWHRFMIWWCQYCLSLDIDEF